MFRCMFRLMAIGALLAGGAYAFGYWDDPIDRVRAASAGIAADALADRAEGLGERAEALGERVGRKAEALADKVERNAEALADKVDREGIREAGSSVATTIGNQAERAGEALGEARLTAKIRAKMALDDTIEARRLNVDTAGTVVTVRGSVASASQRQRVLQLARETEGVTSVVDRIVVSEP